MNAQTAALATFHKIRRKLRAQQERCALYRRFCVFRMAEGKSPSCSRPDEGAGGASHRQMPEAWQRAWLNRHRRQLISRMSTMDIIDVLIEKGSIDTDQDAYQNIAACHYQQRNERARLLLDFLLSRSNTQDHFWDFQAALLETGLGDLSSIVIGGSGTPFDKWTTLLTNGPPF